MHRKAVVKLQQHAETGLPTWVDHASPFFSDVDTLAAGEAHALAPSLPQLVTVFHALNLRFRLPSLIEIPAIFNIQNMEIAL